MEELRGFDWRRTRQIVLTVNPLEFSDGQEAHQGISKHRTIAGLIRNIQRGKKIKNKSGQWIWLYKPVKIRKWKWFLEWYRNGYPHWHLFVETEAKGNAGMIGGDRIRYYWQVGAIVREDYIRSKSHWHSITGYFHKNGYFNKNKKHQTRLPKWALENDEIRIRRSGSSIKNKSDGPKTDIFDRVAKTTEVIDLRTGEVLRTPKKRLFKKRTYKAIINSCGKRTKIRIMSDQSTIIGIFNIPYKKVRKEIPGHYEDRKGYAFNIDRKTIDWLFDNALHIELFHTSKYEIEMLRKALDRWHEIRIKKGYWEYMKHYG
ncbi:hypothetical protein OAC89_04075 [Deltaproteobacteria bacterium]|nr:hypothetical protein [Deltaproteobacteria bacterium]